MKFFFLLLSFIALCDWCCGGAALRLTGQKYIYKGVVSDGLGMSKLGEGKRVSAQRLENGHDVGGPVPPFLLDYPIVRLASKGFMLLL